MADIHELESRVETLEREIKFLRTISGRAKDVTVYISTFEDDEGWVKYAYHIYSPGKGTPLKGAGQMKKDQKVVELLAISMALDALQMVASPQAVPILKVNSNDIYHWLNRTGQPKARNLKDKLDGVQERMRLFPHVHVKYFDCQDPMADELAEDITKV